MAATRSGRWRPRGTAEWLATAASALALAAGAYLWFGPTGTLCTQSGAAPPVCHGVSAAAQAYAPWQVPTIVVGMLLAAAVPYLARRRRGVVLAWAGAVVAFYVVSFGVDLAALPAAAFAIAAAIAGGRAPS